MLKNLYIFEPTINFNQVDPSSILLTQPGIELTHANYHTSLGDLTAQQICSIAEQFDTITFVDQGFNKQSIIYKETIILLNFLQHSNTVINFVKGSQHTFINNQKIYQRPDTPTLWTFGCSHTEGIGLNTFEQSYGSIMSKYLEYPLVTIAQSGSSIEWSLRHLINADLHAGDIVVWQITTPERFTKASDSNGHVTEVLLKNGSAIDIEFFSDPQIFYHFINYLNIGLQYLRSQPVKFAITSLDSRSDLYYNCLTEFTKNPEYCYLPGSNVDMANDNIHYGPISHQNLANGLLKFLKR